jgi:thioredoxin reductase (NADPH)
MLYDCIIIGAGPGGLQASIYLGRFNRKVLIIDRSGGRTRHAKHIENYLTQESISGSELIDRGIAQALKYNVSMKREKVENLKKKESFEVYTADSVYLSKFVIVSSGVYDNLPEIENLHKFLGTFFFTCVDCDGYKTTGKKLIVIGNSYHTVHLALAMKEMFTDDITLILYYLQLSQDYQEELKGQNISFMNGRPLKIIGDNKIESLELQDGQKIECEVIMSNFGFKLNDQFLAGLGLKRDGREFKYETSRSYESSLHGLYIVGPLNTGNDQAIIAAGQGAVAAIDINKRLLEY